VVEDRNSIASVEDVAEAEIAIRFDAALCIHSHNEHQQRGS
jgi:hypothetical protein